MHGYDLFCQISSGKSFANLNALFVFHDGDDICPVKFFLRNGRFVVKSSVFCFVLRRKEFCCCWASMPCLIADKEDAHECLLCFGLIFPSPERLINAQSQICARRGTMGAERSRAF